MTKQQQLAELKEKQAALEAAMDAISDASKEIVRSIEQAEEAMDALQYAGEVLGGKAYYDTPLNVYAVRVPAGSTIVAAASAGDAMKLVPLAQDATELRGATADGSPRVLWDAEG